MFLAGGCHGFHCGILHGFGFRWWVLAGRVTGTDHCDAKEANQPGQDDQAAPFDDIGDISRALFICILRNHHFFIITLKDIRQRVQRPASKSRAGLWILM